MTEYWLGPSHSTSSIEESEGCPWRVWWRNTHADHVFPAHYHQYCYNCAYWLVMAHTDATPDPSRVAIVVTESEGPVHYSFSRATDSTRGHGGRKFTFRLIADDSILSTTNLWYQGTPPAHLRDLFPVSAVQLTPAPK